MIYKLKQIYFFVLFLSFSLFFSACNKEMENVNPAGKVISVTGISPVYSVQLQDYLKIIPKIVFSNEGGSVQYEWSINNKIVSREKELDYKCIGAGEFGCYFKVSTVEGARIVQFKLYVQTSYDKGLVLLSEVDGESAVTFKRLDKLESQAFLYAFKNNNPLSSLGKKPLSVCWTGEGITNPRNIEDNGGLDVIISSANPTKVYIIGGDDFKVKNEIIYNGEGEFFPNKIISPYGWQNFAWVKNSDRVLFFIGGGKEYLLNGYKNFLIPGEKRILDKDVVISDLSCNLISRNTDFIKVYYDLTYKRLVYSCYLGQTINGRYGCDVDEPMNLLACDGEYSLAERYEPHNVILIGRSGTNVKVLRFSPSCKKQEEVLLGKIDATGHIGPDCATGVNPIRPFLYYSDDKGNIYSCNYENNQFPASPYISLGENYNVKSIIFNPYDADTMYIAAEDRLEGSSLKAAIFVYNVKDHNVGKKVFEGKNVGGRVRQMIYKGDGREYVKLFSF